ncbi:MAG: hypothetical protein R3C05_23595 [Pirellulaceae bacterium]
MADDIEAFLRRAAQRRKEQAGRKQPAPPRPRPEYTDSRTERQVQRERPEDIVVEAELIDDTAGLSQLAGHHLKNEHLASQIEMADEKMEAHLTKVFDHSVGKLGPGQSFDASQAMAEGDIAKTLISLLQSPQGLQQALLLREVIDRPTHRWE